MFFGVVVLLLLGQVPVIQQESTDDPFTLTNSTPEAGGRLDAQASITLFFNRRIDCDSVSTAVTVTPTIAGAFTCVGFTVTFAPDEPYTVDTIYRVRVRDTLRSDDGATLNTGTEIHMYTNQSLLVSQLIPANGSESISVGSDFTVVFDRPVIPLGTSVEQDDLPQPLSFDPPLTGTGEWVNTFVYRFEPGELLPPASVLTVTVDGGLTAADGTSLPEPFVAVMTTAEPQFRSYRLAQATSYTLQPQLNVYFNMAVDRVAVEEGFTLRPASVYVDDTSDDSLDLSTLTLDDPISGSFRWENGAHAIFTPDEELLLETTYVAQIATDAITTPAQETLWSFSTLPYPQLLDQRPDDGAVTDSYFGFNLTFNTYMNAETINERLTIDPEPEFFNGYRSNFQYIGSFEAKGSTLYTINIEPGIEDIYGNTYDEPITFTYETEPYEPSLSLRVPRGIGFYNAYKDDTSFFVRHLNVDKLGMQLYTTDVSTFPMLLLGNREIETSLLHERLLREWQIEVPSPQDTSFPSLVSLGGAVGCEGRSDFTLAVGDVATVNTESEAYSHPVDGAAQMRLFAGYQVPVISGPVCVDEEVWWQLEVDETEVWVDEEQAALEYAATTETAQIDVVNADGSALAPGIYVLQVSMDDPLPENPYVQSHTLMVMTANLTMKTGRDTVTVWVTDVQSGEPLAAQPITIYSADGIIAAGVTDDDGLLTVPVDPVENIVTRQRVAMLHTDEHFGVGMSGWADGIDPGMFEGISARFSDQNYQAAIYTDREAYRPGETVYYRGVVRARDDMTYTVPTTLDTVTVSICTRGDCTEREIELTPFGTFDGSLTLAEDARPSGYNEISVTATLADTPFFFSRTFFSVAEFRLPEYAVDVRPAVDDYAAGETMPVMVDGAYYSGGPVSDAAVDYQIVASPLTFRYTGDESYEFFYADPDRDSWSQRQVGEGSAETDNTGTALLEIPARLGERAESQRFMIEATMRDLTDQSVTNRTTVNVHAGEYYIGTRTEHSLARVDETATVNLIVVDWDSQGIPDQTVEVEVVRRLWNNVQRRDPVTGQTQWEYATEDVPVTAGQLTTDAEGKATYTFTPREGGIHYVIFTTRDSLGNEIINDARLWVTSRDYVPWRMNNNNRIDLIPDQDGYNVGETAEILIASPFQGEARALVTVERAGVMYSEVVVLDSNSTIYELLIEEGYAPNIFVSVVIVSGVTEFNPVTEFRVGLVQLPVSIEQKRLTVEIEPEVERAQPEDTVVYRVRTTDHAGEPVQAEVGVALTDAAALVIAPPPSQQDDWLLDQFYQTTGLAVRTSTPLTINADRVTQDILDAIKGGGGGGGNSLPTAFDLRENFVSTAYWNATVVTNEDGEATFEVNLPDNLTTWTLYAYALTDGEDGATRFGQASEDIISTLPVLIRPVTPRFMVVDDELNFAAVVNNNTTEAITADVWLEVNGVTLHGDQRQTVEIAPAGRARVDWPVTVEDVQAVEAVFYVASQDETYTDASRPTLGQGDDQLLPVYRYEVQETASTSGVLREEGQRLEAISLPDVDINEGELVIQMQSSLAATTLGGLDYLRTYPHLCIEQTVSRFLPNIITYATLAELGLENETLEIELNAALDLALQKLYAEQQVDGGWGWYLGEGSHPVTTAYVLIGLVEAQQQGFYVEPTVIEAGRAFVRSMLEAPQRSTPNWRLNRQAFLLYALARSGDPQVAAASNLFDVRDRLNYDALAYLALTLYMIDPQATTRTDAILSDFNNAAIITATGTHWEETYFDRWNWSTDTRTNALALELLVTLTPESDLIPGLVRWLMGQRERDHWETTQETAWSVMALTHWMQVSGDFAPSYHYDVSLNGEEQLEYVTSEATIYDTFELAIDVEQMLQAQVNEVLFSREAGPGNLYYTAYLDVTLPVPAIEAYDQGVVVQRTYSLAGDEDRTPITEARIGENVEVRLTVVVPQTRHYLNIEDPIPAGTEAIDPGLATSQQIGTQPSFSRVDVERGWGWWWFSNIEFRDDRVVLSSSYLPPGVYEYVYTIRPSLPGTFNVIPATAQEFYYPEIYGRSDGMIFTVLPALED